MAAFRKALGGKQAFGGNLSMSIKDAFEMLIKIFHRNGTELVKDTSDFHSVIGVGVASILGGHEQTVSLLTFLTQFRRVVILAGVRMAATGNQIAATTETTCSFQP